MRVSLIAAVAKNRVIGVKNRLPWHIPADLKYFRRITSGHPVIMGRKTFESIGKPLPGRLNVVVSRNRDLQLAGAAVVDSLDEALILANPADEAFVIGGEGIFKLILPRADRLYLTMIDRDFPGDTYFPEWDPARFKEIKREDIPQDGEMPGFSFVVLERI